MADRIKGITIEIDGDTTGLSKALKGVNSDLKSTQTQLKDVNNLLKVDPSNVELLTQKQDLLKNKVSDLEEKLRTEKEALAQLSEQDSTPEVVEQQKALEREIISTQGYLNDAKKELKEFGSVGEQQMKAVGDKCAEVGGKVESVGKAFVPVSAAAGALAGASIAAFKEVDAGADIIAAKTGATGEALKEMTDSMNNIATSIPTDFETAGDAIGEVNTRFHLTGEALEELSTQFIEFAKLNNTSVSDSIDQTQKALSAFGLSSDYAGNLLDRLNQVGQETGAGMDSLLNGLIQNGTAFQELGLSIDQATVFMGQMETSGANSETVMQGLRKALKNAAADGIPLNQALSDLQDTILNGTDGMDGLTAAYDLFGKSGDQIYGAVKSGTLDFNELAGAAEDAGGSVSDTFEETLDPLDQWTMTFNELKVMGAELGDSLATVLLPVAEKIADVVKALAGWFDGLSDGQKNAVSDIILITIAIAPLLMGIGKLLIFIPQIINAIQVLTPIFSSLNAVMAANPIGLVILAIAALIAIFVALWNNCDAFREFWLNLWDNIVAAFGAAHDFITQKITDLQNFLTYLKDTAISVKDGIVQTITNLVADVQTTISNIKAAIAEGVENVKGKVEEVKGSIANVIQGIKDKFSELKEHALTWGKDLIDNFVAGITGSIDKVVKGVKKIANTIKDYIGFSEPDKGPLSRFHTFSPDMIDLWNEGIDQNINKVKDGVSSVAGTVAAGAQNTVNMGTSTFNISGAQNPQQVANAVDRILQQKYARAKGAFA